MFALESATRGSFPHLHIRLTIPLRLILFAVYLSLVTQSLSLVTQPLSHGPHKRFMRGSPQG
jgi:hypothetical protein